MALGWVVLVCAGSSCLCNRCYCIVLGEFFHHHEYNLMLKETTRVRLICGAHLHCVQSIGSDKQNKMICKHDIEFKDMIIPPETT